MRTTTPRALYVAIPAETVVLTVDGSIVGTFVPVGAATPDAVELALGPIRKANVTRPEPPATSVVTDGVLLRSSGAVGAATSPAALGAGMSQAAKDAVLRKVARGKA